MNKDKLKDFSDNIDKYLENNLPLLKKEYVDQKLDAEFQEKINSRDLFIYLQLNNNGDDELKFTYQFNSDVNFENILFISKYKEEFYLDIIKNKVVGKISSFLSNQKKEHFPKYFYYMNRYYLENNRKNYCKQIVIDYDLLFITLLSENNFDDDMNYLFKVLLYKEISFDKKILKILTELINNKIDDTIFSNYIIDKVFDYICKKKGIDYLIKYLFKYIELEQKNDFYKMDKTSALLVSFVEKKLSDKNQGFSVSYTILEPETMYLLIKQYYSFYGIENRVLDYTFYYKLITRNRAINSRGYISNNTRNCIFFNFIYKDDFKTKIDLEIPRKYISETYKKITEKK